MLHGDIANSRSSCIGIRCEGTLFKINDSLFSKILPFSHRIKKAEVDKQVKSLMDYIFWETEMTVVLVIDNDHYDKKVEEFLKDFHFCQICNVQSLSEVTMMLNTGYLSYFIDNDKIELHNLNSKYAMDLLSFDKILKRNRKVSRI